MRIFLLVSFAAAVLMLGFCESGVEKLSDNWATKYRGGGADSYASTRLVRRVGSERKVVAYKIYDALYVEDDCVVYFDMTHELYGACGDRPPVFVAASERDSVVALHPEVIRVKGREYRVEDIKRAARDLPKTAAGGTWYVQPDAFPPEGREAELQVYRDYGGTIHLFSAEIEAYRYLDDDCLMYVGTAYIRRNANGVRIGDGFGVSATCGNGYNVPLGSVEEPADINAGDDIRMIEGWASVSDLKRKTLVEGAR